MLSDEIILAHEYKERIFNSLMDEYGHITDNGASYFIIDSKGVKRLKKLENDNLKKFDAALSNAVWYIRSRKEGGEHSEEIESFIREIPIGFAENCFGEYWGQNRILLYPAEIMKDRFFSLANFKFQWLRIFSKYFRKNYKTWNEDIFGYTFGDTMNHEELHRAIDNVYGETNSDEDHFGFDTIDKWLIESKGGESLPKEKPE